MLVSFFSSFFLFSPPLFKYQASWHFDSFLLAEEADFESERSESSNGETLGESEDDKQDDVGGMASADTSISGEDVAADEALIDDDFDIDDSMSSSSDDGGSVGGRGADVLSDDSGEHKGFLKGGKEKTFLRAVSRILDSSAGSKLQGPTEAPILAGSKSLARRRAEEAESLQAEKAARKLRREMRQRGHVIPSKRGNDPKADAREKALQRTATKGVVRLFNAVTKAQRQLREAEAITGSRNKAAKLGKASFLAELRNKRPSSLGSNTVEPIIGGPQDNSAGHVDGRQQSPEDRLESEWKVLQDDFTGLQGGNKMKDWDRDIETDEEAKRIESDDASSDGSSSEDGW